MGTPILPIVVNSGARILSSNVQEAIGRVFSEAWMNTTVQIAIARAVSTDDRRTYVLFEGAEMVFIFGSECFIGNNLFLTSR